MMKLMLLIDEIDILLKIETHFVSQLHEIKIRVHDLIWGFLLECSWYAIDVM